MSHETFVTVIKTDNMTFYDGKYRNQLLAWDGEGKAYHLEPVKETVSRPNELRGGMSTRRETTSVEWERVPDLDHPEVS